MLVLILYLAILTVSCISIIVRRQPILLRGMTLVWFNAIALVLFLVLRPDPAFLWIVLFAIILGLSWLFRHNWFVFHVDPRGLEREIENRLKRVLLGFIREANRYRLNLEGEASIEIRPLGKVQALTFAGNWRQNRARVGRRFLAKYFDPVIPRPRFRV